MTTLTSPHDLLAAIPFLIGYHPTDSLVIVSIHDESVGMAMRIDYPDVISDSAFALLASHLLRQSSEAAILVAYIPEGRSDGEEVLTALTAACTRADIGVKESILVCNSRFRSLLCSDLQCCPPEGSPIPDITSSRIAAERVADGVPMPFTDIAELAGSMAPLSQSLDQGWLADVGAFFIDPQSAELIDLQRDGATAIIDLAGEFEQGRYDDAELIARVIGRLSDIQVRDFALGSHTDQNVDTYWQLWRHLIQIAPSGYVAPVACLFASLAYERGEGALAHRALDRALEDQPRYSLAALLRRVFTAGWPPESFQAMRRELHPKVCAGIFG